MVENKTQWKFTGQELLLHMEILGIKKGELCLIPQKYEGEAKISQDEVLEKRSEMKEEELGLLDRCISILVNPDRLLHLHINLGDRRVSRLSLASAKTSPGMWVGLGHEEENYRILLHGDSELKLGLIDSLAAEIPLGETQIGADLSTPAALAFLSVLDQYKRSHMFSMLEHAEPISIFSKEDIEKLLTTSDIHDFRWLLPFTDKLMPIRINQLEFSENTKGALAELVALGIIENIDEESKIYDLEPITLSIAEGYRQNISVAGIGHTAKLDTEELVHDVFLFIRTPGDLILIVMSGGEASLVGINPEELQNLLDSLLINLPIEENQIDDQMPAEAAKTEEISVKAEKTKESSEVNNVKRFCKNCGSPITPGAKFCRGCGNKL